MHNIVPHLWFDKEAAEAAAFYCQHFPRSEIRKRLLLPDSPSGTAELVVVDLAGQEFQLLSAGPLFHITPAISFRFDGASAAEVDALAAALAEGGSFLMPLGRYPFAERYAWVVDRFGVSWQLMFRSRDGKPGSITPTLMFVGDQCGRAEEAVSFYASLLDGSVGGIERYGPGMEPDKPEAVKHAAFSLVGQPFAALDSGHAHDFGFNEAVSLLVVCDSQSEIDHLWSALSADPQAEACGWLKDRYGVSWQINPRSTLELLNTDDPARFARVAQVMYTMKKLDLELLERAYRGE